VYWQQPGGLVFSGTLDGTFTAFDDEELKAVMELQRWHGDHRSTYQLLGQWQAIRRGPRRRWP
jgi:hypothetical protein